MKKLILLCAFTFGLFQISLAQSFDVQIHGSGQPIVLIPGLASSGEVWDETVALLSSDFECHILTLPGFAGQSPIELKDGFLPQMKVEIGKYLTDLEQPAILMGHSLGGFLSLQLAHDFPDQVAKAIIVDSYPFYSAAMNPAATVDLMKPMAEQTRQMLSAMSMEDFEKQQTAGMPIMTTSLDRIPTAVKWSMQSDRNTFTEALYELMVTDYREALSTVKTPLLVLGAWYSGKDYGLTEESVKANFSRQYQLAENVQIEMAPTAHHFIMWDNPDWFIEKVSAFIR
ncbi:alpha/beta fold hydrolase [Algoriphagus namhaensis]